MKTAVGLQMLLFHRAF